MLLYVPVDKAMVSRRITEVHPTGRTPPLRTPWTIRNSAAVFGVRHWLGKMVEGVEPGPLIRIGYGRPMEKIRYR